MTVLLAVLFVGLPVVLIAGRPVQVRTLLHVRVPMHLHAWEPGVEEDKEYIRLQPQLVKEREVLTAALSQPEVAGLRVVREQPDPVAWLEGELRVDYDLAPEVLRISMRGKNWGELKVIVTAVREAYLKVANQTNTRSVRMFEDTVVTR